MDAGSKNKIILHQYSPEQFLHILPKDNAVFVQSTPIKGTRFIDFGWTNREEFVVLSKRRLAELTILLDMVRNDFGRFGYFAVRSFHHTEKYVVVVICIMPNKRFVALEKYIH